MAELMPEVAALDPYQRWMVKSNLKHIADGEMTREQCLAILRHNGYPSIAAAVEKLTEEE